MVGNIGGPPPYAFVGRIYNRSLRPVVIGCAILGGIWTMIWAVGAFQDLNGDKEDLPSFIAFDIALGAMYATAALTQAYAILAAVVYRLILVRIYTYLAVLAALVVTAAELMRTVLHFQFKDALIHQCTLESSSESISTGSSFWGSTTPPLSEVDANQWCQESWSRTTFSDLAWFIVATILAWFFAAIAFSFYHQVLDPSSVLVSYPRMAYSNQPDIALHPYPAHGQSPYAGQQYNPSFGADYVPPYDPQKLPGYASEETVGSSSAAAAAAAAPEKTRGYTMGDDDEAPPTPTPTNPTTKPDPERNV